MKHITKAFLSVCAFAITSHANVYDDFASYEIGKDNSWFFTLKTESQKPVFAKSIEARLVQTITDKKVSDYAFVCACKILKPIATELSLPILKSALSNPARVSAACDVLVGMEDDGEDAIIEFLSKPQSDLYCLQTAISTLASFDDDGVKTIAKYATSKDEKLATFATIALGSMSEDDVLPILQMNLKNGTPDVKKAAARALVAFAENAYASGDKSSARKALNSLPVDYPLAVVLRAKLDEKKACDYLDSLIIKGGELVAPAGRAMNSRRDFNKSAKIIAAFPTLSKESKLAAMGSFMLSGDTRFYPIIAPELESEDSDIRSLAIYSARFICTDEANLRKIWNAYILKRKPDCDFAKNVFAENPSFACKKILLELADNGDLNALEFLVMRGDLNALKTLWKKYEDSYADDSNGDKRITSIVENTLTYGDMPMFVKYLAADYPEKLSDTTAKIIIKKLAKSRDAKFIKFAFEEIKKTNKVPADNKYYKFIAEKLKIL